jgi:segregation and condensation protein A
MMYPLDLEALVAETNWKEMLIDLVETEKLDPWSIDIAFVADKFVERVRTLQMLDLHVAANVVLASSILLRMKAETLLFEEEEEPNGEVETTRVIPQIPSLTLKLRLPPPRRVTLQELIRAIEEIMKIQQRVKKPLQQQPQQIPIQINLNEKEIDIDKLMEETYKSVREKVDSYGLVTFSQLVKNKSVEEIIRTFVPLLFLMKNGKVLLFQEEFFGEIFIKVL